MKFKFFFSGLILTTIFAALAQDQKKSKQVAGKSSELAEPYIIDISLGDICWEELVIKSKVENNKMKENNQCEQKASQAPQDSDGIQDLKKNLNKIIPLISQSNPIRDSKLEKQEVCESILNLSEQDPPSLNFSKKDNVGQEWKIRFHFGFTRTNYKSTNLKLNSSRVNVLINDFEFEERTSSHFYNPRNWNSFQRGFQWIDEPTNTFTFSLERDKDAFFLTIFHPKFLKRSGQIKHVTGSIDGVEVDQIMHLNQPFVDYTHRPGEMNLINFNNTHYQMDWQIGYGRKINVYNGKKGKITYTPRFDLGISSGQNSTSYLQEGKFWDYDVYKDKHRIQGVNASLGQRIEYQKGKVGAHIDQKFVASKLKHGFMDGSASYNMLYTPITFGISFDLFTIKNK